MDLSVFNLLNQHSLNFIVNKTGGKLENKFPENDENSVSQVMNNLTRQMKRIVDREVTVKNLTILTEQTKMPIAEKSITMLNGGSQFR